MNLYLCLWKAFQHRDKDGVVDGAGPRQLFTAAALVVTFGASVQGGWQRVSRPEA